MAVFQLRLHDEVDELTVIWGSGVGDVGIVQLPIWGDPWSRDNMCEPQTVGGCSQWDVTSGSPLISSSP